MPLKIIIKLFEAYHQSIQENIPGQPSRANQPTAAHSSNAWAKVSSPQVTKASIKTSQEVKLLGREHQPTKNNTTTPPTASHQEHHHS
jgi:hypothetical protein